jgi:hypothetical protein
MSDLTPVRGARLRRLAERTLHPTTIETVVLPALADLQHECASASTSTRLRAYWGVWKAMGICVFVDAIHDRERQTASLGARTLLFLALLVVLITLPTVSSMMSFGARVGLLPALTAGALMLPSNIALALPCALFLALALHRCSSPQPVTRLVPSAILGAVTCGALFVVMISSVIPAGNQMYREYVFAQLQADGVTATLNKGLAEMTWSELNDRIRHAPSNREEQRARFHRQGRVAMVAAVFVLATLGLSLAGLCRSRAVSAVVASVLLVSFGICFTQGWNHERFPEYWGWGANVAFLTLGVSGLRARKDWSARSA